MQRQINVHELKQKKDALIPKLVKFGNIAQWNDSWTPTCFPMNVNLIQTYIVVVTKVRSIDELKNMHK